MSHAAGTYTTRARAGLERLDRARLAQHLIARLAPSQLVNVATAFAEVGRPSQPVFDAVAAATLQRRREFTPLEMAQIGWAFAQASFAVPRVWRNQWGESEDTERDETVVIPP